MEYKREDINGAGGIQMRIKIATVFLISIYSICSSIVIAYGQSSNYTVGPGVSIPQHLTEGQVPSGYITGYVFDQEGQPIPGATVTLLQNGQLWRPGKFQFFSGENPQKSLPMYSNEGGFLSEGGFLFGFTEPGTYILRAEKDGFKTDEVIVQVGGNTLSANQLESVPLPIMANVTISGYHRENISSGQQLYPGAIAGTLWAAGGYGVMGVNVSLWQDGKLVDRMDNPQASFTRNFYGKRIDYLFEHVVPGNYTVMVNYSAGGDFTDTALVEVKDQPMRADIILSQLLTRPVDFPFITYSPIVGDFNSSPDDDFKNTKLPTGDSNVDPAAIPGFSIVLTGVVIIIIGYCKFPK